jgi:uncharacterized protein (TIGR02099 family)
MKRVLRAVEVLAWLGFFAVAGTVLAVRFWLLPDIERYRDDIVAAVSRTVGQPVKIGRIEAGWLGIHPEVNLYDVRILDAQGREALVLPSVENSIAWRSLVMGSLRMNALTIDGPRLTVLRDAQGQLFVGGMKVAPADGARRAEGGFAGWVLAQPEIVIRNAEIEWRDEKRGAPPLALSTLNLRLRNSLGGQLSAGLTARVPAELGGSLELRAELSSRSLADPAGWRGRLYAETGYTDLAGWRAWVDYPVDLVRGHGAARLWVTLEAGALAAVTADLHLADLVEGMQPMDVRATWAPAGESGRGSLAARAADLDTLVRISQAFPVPEDGRRRIAELAPRGLLSDLRLEWVGLPSAPSKVSGRAKFADLSMNPSGEVPGFSGLSGSIEASDERGTLSVDAKQAALLMPAIFPEPRLAFDTFSTQVSWEAPRAAGGPWSVKVGALSFANADVEGKVSGTYSNPGTGRGAIDLTADVKRAKVYLGQQYLPKGSIMGEAVRDYLATAIKAGDGHDGRLRLRGALDDFPYVDPATGEFNITVRIDNGVLEPGGGWPEIRGIDVHLVFDRDRMELVGHTATTLGARLADVRVAIPQVSARPGRLVANGRAEGALEDFLKYVAASPVHSVAGAFTEGMSGKGTGKLALKLDIPLGDMDRTAVAGDFSFTAPSFVAHPRLPPIERASGAFSFTESSLVIREGRGRLLGGPLSVSGGTRPGAGLHIVARGDASVAGLQPIVDPALLRHFSGAAPFTATLALREGRGRVLVESSLRGLASALPPPLAKEAAQALPLRIELAPAEGGRDRVAVRLGTLAAAEILRDAEGGAMPQRAAIWFSPPPGQPVRLPESGILVYGSLPALDADRWMAVLGDSKDRGQAPISKSEIGASPQREIDTGPLAFDVKIGTLDASGKRIRDLALRGAADGTGWKANVQAVELAGDLSYRSEGGGQLVARLSHLTVPGDTPGAPEAREGGGTNTRELPAVDLVAERFRVKDLDLGRVEVAAVREGPNWRIAKVGVTNPDGELTGKGLWRTGPASYTALNLELDSPDAGRLLARLGYPDVVRGARTKMHASLAWSGDPVSIDYPSLSGELQLDSDDGQFLEVDPGIGKLLSIMSLQQLPKRLALDFRDVFSKGFQFDRIHSGASIEKGLMQLKDFQMRGSAADVDMSGQVDLARETQALRVRVVPQIGDTASTALLFVNPFLFFPAAIAQRILKDPLGHIFAFNYSVSGSWADPKIERTRVEAQPLPEPAPEGGRP